MKPDERNSPDLVWAERLEEAYRRRLKGLPPEPWLPLGMNLTAARRTVARLRSGALHWHHPRMSTEALADTLEQGIELSQAELDAAKGQLEQELEDIARRNAEFAKCQQDFIHTLKKMPEAADRDSEVAGWLREINHNWRKIQSRPRGRPKRK